jgi:hypothetical protein
MKKIFVLMAVITSLMTISAPVHAANISESVQDSISGGPPIGGSYVTLYKIGKDHDLWKDGVWLEEGETYFYFENHNQGKYRICVTGENYHYFEYTFKIKEKKEKEIPVALQPHDYFIFDVSMSNWAIPESGGTVTLTGKLRNNTSYPVSLTAFVSASFWTSGNSNQSLYGNPDLLNLPIQIGANDDIVFSMAVTIPSNAPNETCIYPSVMAGISKWEPKTSLINLGCIAKDMND